MENPSVFDLAEADRLLTTTKAVRRRLDLDRPVERSVTLECIELGLYAPNASNAQDWHWVVVDDPDVPMPMPMLPCYDVAGAAKCSDHLLGEGADVVVWNREWAQR